MNLFLILFFFNGMRDFALGAGPKPYVDPATALNYVLLAQSGITNVPNSVLQGSIGVSPISSTAITGFGLVRSSDGTYATSTQVSDRVFAADYNAPTPETLVIAIRDERSAYVDAAGRSPPDKTELQGGIIAAPLSLSPGIYKWSTDLVIGSDVTLVGACGDTWIFQIAGNLNQASSVQVSLSGGALAANVYWQVAGQITMLSSATSVGLFLGGSAIILGVRSVIEGRLFAQTAITLDQSSVLQPVRNELSCNTANVTTSSVQDSATSVTSIGTFSSSVNADGGASSSATSTVAAAPIPSSNANPSEMISTTLLMLSTAVSSQVVSSSLSSVNLVTSTGMSTTFTSTAAAASIQSTSQPIFSSTSFGGDLSSRSRTSPSPSTTYTSQPYIFQSTSTRPSIDLTTSSEPTSRTSPRPSAPYSSITSKESDICSCPTMRTVTEVKTVGHDLTTLATTATFTTTYTQTQLLSVPVQTLTRPSPSTTSIETSVQACQQGTTGTTIFAQGPAETVVITENLHETPQVQKSTILTRTVTIIASPRPANATVVTKTVHVTKTDSICQNTSMTKTAKTVAISTGDKSHSSSKLPLSSTSSHRKLSGPSPSASLASTSSSVDTAAARSSALCAESVQASISSYCHASASAAVASTCVAGRHSSLSSSVSPINPAVTSRTEPAATSSGNLFAYPASVWIILTMVGSLFSLILV